METFPTPESPEAASPTGCLFCGDTDARRTREHVFPRWLLRDFDLAEDGVAPLHMSSDFKLLSRRLHRLADLVEGRVCETCNNGWMSDLEVEVQPILGPLIAGTAELDQLTRSERLTLARWTVKTAYMLNWSANYPRKVPTTHLRALMRAADLPEQVVVMACPYDGDSRFAWLQGPTWMLDLVSVCREEAGQISARSYKISINLGRVMLMTACWPDPDWAYRLLSDVHRNVWPPRALWMIGDPGGMPESDDPLFPLHWFHAMLGVSDPGSWQETTSWRGSPLLWPGPDQAP
jgi:hypothetical protein